MDSERLTGIERSALLADRVRRALHDYVSASLRPVDRDTAAAATGISRSLAAFHLDRLAHAGLLEVEYQHRGERRGPGAGRPAKFYRRAGGQQVDLSVPRRRYELASRLLAQAIDSGSADEPVKERVIEAARTAGRALARQIGEQADADALVDALRREGYEPMPDEQRIMLRNCPFDALVEEHRPLICGMNLAFLEGAAEGAGDAGLAAERDVRPGFCCVSLRRPDRA